MSLVAKFIYIVIKRNFFPTKGAKNRWQSFFQCKLPLLASWLILFFLCLIGVIVIGVYDGFNKVLQQNEKNPFTSSISIDGNFSQEELLNMKNQIFFNKNLCCFQVREKISPDCIEVVKAVNKYNIISPTFIKQTGEPLFSKSIDMLSMEVDKKSDLTQWIQERLIGGNNFFTLNDQEGIIISQALLKKLGYTFNKLPENINIIDIHQLSEFIQKRNDENRQIDCKLSQKERIKYLIEIPLINVAKYLPGDAIVPEEYHRRLINNYYFPCRNLNRFYMELSDKKIDEKMEIIISKLLKKMFPNEFKEIHVFPNKKKVKVDFYNDNKVSKCNVKLMALELERQLALDKPLIIKFKFVRHDSNSKDKSYHSAYLYINKEDAIIQNIEKILPLIQKKYGSIGNINQIMTLRSYQNNIKRISKLMWCVLLTIGSLIGVYIILTFSLILQTKMNIIGVMMSFGASIRIIRCIYIIESIIMIIFPLIMSIFIGIFLDKYFGIKNYFDYYTNYYHLVYFFWGSLIISIVGVLLAVNHIVSQTPYQLISYRV